MNINSIPMMGTLINLSKNPERALDRITDPKIKSNVRSVINDINNNPTKALTKYTNTIKQTYSNAAENIQQLNGDVDSEFIKEMIQKDVLEMDQYTKYLTYKLITDAGLSNTRAVIFTLLTTTVGVYWKIITFGKYKLTKQLADKLVKKVKKKGMTSTVIKSILIMMLQMGLVLIAQIISLIAGLYNLMKEKPSIMKAIGFMGMFIIVFTISFIMIWRNTSDSISTVKWIKEKQQNAT